MLKIPVVGSASVVVSVVLVVVVVAKDSSVVCVVVDEDIGGVGAGGRTRQGRTEHIVWKDKKITTYTSFMLNPFVLLSCEVLLPVHDYCIIALPGVVYFNKECLW